MTKTPPDLKTYQVTSRGREEIFHWILGEWGRTFADEFDHEQLAEAVYIYTRQAELSPTGRIETLPQDIRPGYRATCLWPERRLIRQPYQYYTETDTGVIFAETWEEACTRLEKRVPTEGSYGVLRDPNDTHPDYVVGTLPDEPVVGIDLVHDDTLDLLVTMAMRWGVTHRFRHDHVRPGSLWRDIDASTDQTWIGAILRAENAHSVSQRRGRHVTRPPYVYRCVNIEHGTLHFPVSVPIIVLQSIRSLRRQSCASHDYAQSRAASLLTTIEVEAIRRLADIDDAPWGWTRAAAWRKAQEVERDYD